jgi:hypothetical protein
VIRYLPDGRKTRPWWVASTARSKALCRASLSSALPSPAASTVTALGSAGAVGKADASWAEACTGAISAEAARTPIRTLCIFTRASPTTADPAH